MLLYLLQAGGSLGVSVKGGVEVSSVNSVAGSNLSVEAAGGRLDLVGGAGLTVEGGFTGGGKGVEISSFSDLKLASQSGSVSTFNPFECPCYLPSLLVQVVLSSSSITLANIPTTSDTSSDAVMEVCVCPSGRLYLVPATAPEGCQHDNGICRV